MIYFNKQNIVVIIRKFEVVGRIFPIELHKFWSSQLQNNTEAPLWLFNKLVINI